MKTKTNPIRLTAAGAALAAALGALAPQDLALAASAEKGKATFVSKGCWQCHGFVGQGGVGTKLAPNPLPLDAMTAFVRNTKGRMPPYSEAVLSNEDLADIHAYLDSIPKGADYKSIPLLNP
jgi:ubiquinol-cytochrome c reductase cytochrome c subunit